MVTQLSDKTHYTLQIPVSSPDQTALEHLANNTDLSRQKIKSAMTHGAVWLESSIGIHRIRRAKKILTVNDILHLYYDEAIQNSRPDSAALVADEGEYSIWNKPYGMYSQGTKWGDHHTIYRWAEEHLKPQRPSFLVHRLDRAANGLIILAHSKKMATAFSELFKNHLIIKRYKAVVEGTAEFELPHIFNSDIDGKQALSKTLTLKKVEGDKCRTEITIEIETGRKHQIRRHLAEAGHPVVGDRLYGSPSSDEDLQLQSNYLKFNCPISGAEREYSLDD